MASLNKVTLIGHVGNAPEIKVKQNGEEWIFFSIATSESWKDKQTGEKKESAEWHKIVVFNGRIAALIKSYVKKGSKLYIEGKLKTRKWSDSKAPEIERYTTEIVLDAFSGNIVLLDSKKFEEDEGPVYTKIVDNIKNPGLEPTVFEDDEVPF